MGRFRQLLKLRPSSSASTFQVLSDLHLEVGQQYSSFQIPVAAPNLILAGDIGRLIDYNSFLGFLERHVHSSFKKVFLVLGNHEFYGLSYEQGLKQADKLQQEPGIAGKVLVLHRSTHEIPGTDITLLGSTLWSRIPEHSIDVVKANVKDFQKIQNWTPADHNAVFEEELEWLRGQIESIRANWNSGRKILVITHHAPSIQESSRPEHACNPWTSAFATDIFEHEPWTDVVDVWVFGHTHFTTEFKKGTTKVVSNQRGYVLPGPPLLSRRDEKDQFNIRRTIQIGRS